MEFTDAPDHVGFAVGSRTQRVLLTRRSLQLSLLSPDASVEPLGDALRQIWDVMSPASSQVVSYLATWTAPLDGEYDFIRGGLARRVVANVGHPRLGFVDCSYLVDIEVGDGHDMQAEFGIVSDTELSERLSGEITGQMSRRGFEAERINVDAELLPPVSLYLDAIVLPEPQDFVSLEEVMRCIASLEEQTSSVTGYITDTIHLVDSQ